MRSRQFEIEAMAVAAVCVFASLGVAQDLAQTRINVETTELAGYVADSLGLSQVVVATFAPVCVSDDVIALDVPLPDGPARILLRRHSVRSAGYRLIVQKADGSYVEHVPGVEQTYRGAVEGIDGSVVAASIEDDAVRALVQLPGRDHIWIEPVRVSEATGSGTTHAIYEARAVPTVKRRRVEEPSLESKKTDQLDAAVPCDPDPLVPPRETWSAQLAIDSDVEFFNRFGTVAATEAQISAIINTLNLQFERDVGIQHVLSHVIIRTEPASIYASRSGNTLLYQFSSFWYRYQRDIKRDTAHFFSGKSLSGGNLGVSNSAGVCSTSEGYSLTGYMKTCTGGGNAGDLCETDAECPAGACVDAVCQAFACRTDLAAHELGHIWSAPHCPGPRRCPGWTMNPAVQGANRFHPQFTIPRIRAYLATITSCLDQGDELIDLLVDPPLNGDGLCDLADLAFFVDCASGPGQPLALECIPDDRDGDGDADMVDFSIFQADLGSSQE